MVKDEVGVASPDSGKKITGQTPLLVYFLVNTKTNGNLKKEKKKKSTLRHTAHRLYTAVTMWHH